mgnify:CR=1 FL=1
MLPGHGCPGRVVAKVGGVLVQHDAVGDRIAEAYAMVMPVDSDFADQNDVARDFG